MSLGHKPSRNWLSRGHYRLACGILCLIVSSFGSAVVAQVSGQISVDEAGLAVATYTRGRLLSSITIPVGTQLSDHSGTQWTFTEGTRFLPFDGDFDGDGRPDLVAWGPNGLALVGYQPLQRGSGFQLLGVVANGKKAGSWKVNTSAQIVHGVGDFNGDGQAELVVSGPNAIGLLTLEGNVVGSIAMHRNGKRLGGWVIDTGSNRIEGMGDFNGDGRTDILITSGWGIGILTLDGNKLTSVMLKPKGTRFGGWLYDPGGNPIQGIGDFNGNGRDDILLTSGWGIGILTLDGNTLISVMLKPKGTRFGGWLYDPGRNPIQGIGDFDGNGRDDILLTSGWGIGILTLAGNTLTSVMLQPKGTRFGGWLYGVKNEIGLVGDFDANNRDDFVIRSGWGTGLLTLAGTSLDSLDLKSNGSDLGQWILTREDVIQMVGQLTGGNADVLLLHRDGPPAPATETTPITAPVTTTSLFPRVIDVQMPVSVVGGSAFSILLTLDRAADEGGQRISLQSTQPEVLSVAAYVTVPSGKTSVSVAVSANTVTQTTDTRITAGIYVEDPNSSSQAHQDIRIDPALPVLQQLVVSAPEVYGTETINGGVILDRVVSGTAIVVNLTSSNPAALSVPSTVQVPPGESRAPLFPLTAGAVTANVPVTVTATLGNISSTQPLTVLPYVAMQMVDFVIDPPEIEAGYAVKGTVTLSRNAPPGGTTVYVDMSRWASSQDCIPTLSSADGPYVIVPPTVLIPQGSNSLEFDIETRPGNFTNYCYIDAGLAPQDWPTPKTLLTVRPWEFELTSVQLSPGVVANKGPLGVTFTLNRPVPPLWDSDLELQTIPVGKNCGTNLPTVDRADDCANYVFANPPGYYNRCYHIAANVKIPANESVGTAKIEWPNMSDEKLPRQNCTVQIQARRTSIWDDANPTLFSNRVTVTPPLLPLSLSTFCFMQPTSCATSIQLRRGGTGAGEMRVQLSNSTPTVVLVPIEGDKSGLNVPNSIQINPGTSSYSVGVSADSNAALSTRTLTASHGGVTRSVTIEIIE